jgi:hypothetical protein
MNLAIGQQGPSNPRVLGRQRSQLAALPRRLFLMTAACAWLFGIGYGILTLYRFESTPGAVGTTPVDWPVESAITPHAGIANLIMFVHPECSCTRASLSEVAAIMSSASRVSVQIALFAPLEPDAERSATFNAARRIPGVSVISDPRGIEAARFGALTSGYAVLYDAAGRLQFSGGITAARGHEGNNMGRQQILAILNGQSASSHHAVYGCPLHDKGEKLQ